MKLWVSSLSLRGVWKYSFYLPSEHREFVTSNGLAERRYRGDEDGEELLASEEESES